MSVMQYALLMDEIAKEMKKKNLGVETGGSTKVGCLLWMDDVVLIHETREEHQKMLDTTDDIAKKYHIEFGKEKSKSMMMGKKKTLIKPFNLGNLQLESTEKYKYLGEMLNNKGNMDDQIKEIKRKAEAALQTIFTIAGDQELRGIQMETIWKLVETCIKPIILYAAETWNPTKTEMKKINGILDNIRKRILLTPITTPRETLYIETGITDIEHSMERSKMLLSSIE